MRSGAWHDAKTQHERDELLRGALVQCGGNITLAAQQLGVTRKHLARVCDRPASALPDKGMVKLTIEIPRAVKEWLELKAVERKHRGGGGGRFATAPIVTELIEREIERERQAGRTKGAKDGRA